jgi:2-oxoglutarate ferredoxin oxidoreductase subunit alpha
VFAPTDYRSRVRGGHNFYQIRRRRSPGFRATKFVGPAHGLDGETIDVHVDALPSGAGVIYDESLRLDDRIRYGTNAEPIEARNLRLMPVPLMKIAAEHGSRVMMNMAALGAFAGVTGISARRQEGASRRSPQGSPARC